MVPFNHIETSKPAEHKMGGFTDEEYGKVLDSFAICCVDTVIMNPDGKVLHALRAWEPAKDKWWITGGRMNQGESFEQAATRNTLREMKLAIDPDRFEYVNTYNMVWGVRRQAPQENGSHTVSITMLLQLSWDEIKQLSPNEEFAGTMRWRSLVEIVDSTDEHDHPAMKLLAHDLMDMLSRGR